MFEHGEISLLTHAINKATKAQVVSIDSSTYDLRHIAPSSTPNIRARKALVYVLSDMNSVEATMPTIEIVIPAAMCFVSGGSTRS